MRALLNGLIATMFFAVTASSAWAGDPCPIPIQVYDTVAPWLDRAELLDGLESKQVWIGIRYGKTGGAGIVLEDVKDGSPAKAAGLQVGDVITHLGHQAVRGLRHANQIFDGFGVGQSMRVVLRRANTELEIDFKLGRTDPVVAGLVFAAQKLECREVTWPMTTQEQREAIHAKVFDEDRFRCRDAHTMFQGFDGGDLIVVRARSRILITMPGWDTTCIDVSHHDGSSLKPRRLLRVFEKMTRKYVEDRFENP